jgi:DNA-binding response OmpR family regulator
MRLLLVEDHAEIAQLTAEALARRGHEALVAPDGATALHLLDTAGPLDAILLDLLLPDIDGFLLLSLLRARTPVPILITSALGDVQERVRGLEAGADDYLVKPVHPEELEARLKAVARRGRPSTSVLTFGRLTVDPAARRALVDGEEVRLSRREFDLLHFFCLHPDTALRRDFILDRVWGVAYTGTPAIVDVYVSRLRAALGPAGALVRTVRGVGYLFGETSP